MLKFERLGRIATAAVASALVMVGTLAPVWAEAASQPRDCEANSIMWCGAYTKGEFDQKLNNGDGHNSAGNLQQIYLHEGRGFTQSAFDSASTVDGTVFKDGRVVVGGKVVATGARTIGRDFMTGSVKSGSVWERPTSTSFASDSIPAWVNMSGGSMHWFVVKSCGNMGRGTAVVVATPAPVSPSQKPTPMPTTTPLSFSCVSIAVTQPDKANKPNRYRFTVTPQTSSSVSVTGSRYDFSDIGTVDSPSNAIDRDLNAGVTINVDGHVKTTAGITATTAACSTSVTVPGQVLSATTTTPALPATGAETALGGAVGLTAVGFAARSYLRSKKNLLGALRGFGRRDQ